MSNEFKAEFVVDLDREAILEALTRPVDGLPPAEDGKTTLLLPGFPSFAPVPVPGAICTLLELEPGRLLRVRKEHEPCAGTEIAVVLDDAESGTKITVVQSGFGPWFDMAKDTVVAHGNEIVADFLLFLERGYRMPPKNWGAPLGGFVRQSPTGLVITSVEANSFLGRAGLAEGDLLISLGSARIYDMGQLWVALTFFEPGDTGAVSWARGSDVRQAEAVF